MDSFKLYLPSNASSDLYPRNRPSDYHTRLNDAINVDGEWEVGLESIFYSSNFHDETEKAKMAFHFKTVTSKTVNSSYHYEMVTGSNSNGIGEVLPNTFESNPNKLQSILNTINSINDLILQPHKKKHFGEVFDFSLTNGKNIVYSSYDRGFTLKITSNLSNALGFNGRTTFSGSISIKATSDSNKDTLLSKQDYKVKFLNTKLLHKKTRIIIKTENEAFDGKKQSFLDMWSNSVEKKYNIHVSFQDDKLVIRNENKNLVLSFSSDFIKTFGFEDTIFDTTTHKARSSYLMTQQNLTQQEWYIDIFSNQFDLNSEESHYESFTFLFPWRFKNHKKLYAYINQTVSKHLKKKLKHKYDTVKHSFVLSVLNDDRCLLTLGDWLNVHFSKNLSYLLGFPEKFIQERKLASMREVEALTNRKKQLFLLSNVIKPTAIGSHKLQILQDFLYSYKGERIIEKRFDPIVYLPIMNNYLDMIHIQLTDDSFKPIPIKDSKTIVTLYFRKVKET